MNDLTPNTGDLVAVELSVYRKEKQLWLRDKAAADFLAYRYWAVVPSAMERDHAFRIIQSGFAYKYGEEAANCVLNVLLGLRADTELEGWGIGDPAEVLRRLRAYDPDYAWEGPPV